MTNTRPPGERTGIAVQGCYAAALLDCNGVLEAEHFVSRSVLKQLGKRFTVTGPAWAADGRSSGPNAFKSHVLCARHNRALSPVDTTAGFFYSLVMRAANGQEVGEHTINGEDLERWATKLILGAALSRNLSTTKGQALEVESAPIEWLRFLFSERSLPSNCGFRFVADPIEGMEAPTNLAWQVVPGPANSIAGVSLKVAGCFQFITTVMIPIDEHPDHVTFRRPGGFVLGVPRQLGHIKLRWPEAGLGGSLILNFRRHSATPPIGAILRNASQRAAGVSRNASPVGPQAPKPDVVIARLRSLLSGDQLSARDRRDAEAWLSVLSNASTADANK